MARLNLPGWVGWVATGTVIVLWDLTGGETMSTAYHRGLDHPAARVPVVMVTAIVLAHLLRLLPRGVDPFHLPGRVTGQGNP